ncbi:MAG: DAK2 domain-containing protein [Oscillospiraceae bacterium]|nr:DAK2 domain-containing protein [Oscillospiraceae bacterium]
MTLNGRQFAEMMLAASAAIEAEKQLINDLNVFPVPDGDTGTNMALTLQTAAKALQDCDAEHVGKVAEMAANALLRGARGNSGVILSLLFRGFGKSLKDKDVATGKDWAEALHAGVETAYGAVMKPAEGTMLTVSRVAAAHCLAKALQDDNAEYILTECVTAAEEALAETIHQNPVLTKAGVIDSGGKGLCIIYTAMLQQLRGEFTLETKTASAAINSTAGTLLTAEEITFQYCTEFLVLRNNPRSDVHLLRTSLDAMGDSLVVVEDEQIIKIHLHTDHPGKAMEKAMKHGALTDVKIENMLEQMAENTAGDAQSGAPQLQFVKPTEPYGFVAVVAGDGIAAVFADLGVDGIIQGGQTMNPSTDDIIAQINATPAHTVFVLPNNKNIVLAAEQAVALVSDRRVIVVPTKSIAMGIGAMMAFDPDANADGNAEAMTQAASVVSTGQITYAARNSNFDGMEIAEGDHMAIFDDQLVHNEADRMAACQALVDKISVARPEFVTIFYGEGVDNDEAAKVLEMCETACPDAECTLLNGGQPVYYYLISVE